jgi:hypothetical protein
MTSHASSSKHHATHAGIGTSVQQSERLKTWDTNRGQNWYGAASAETMKWDAWSTHETASAETMKWNAWSRHENAATKMISQILSRDRLPQRL